MSAEAANGSATSLRIADSLREAILSGDFPPGSRLRQEEIAERLGSSRLPVRDALRILEADGLVTLKAYSGAWVAALDYDEFDTAYRIRERVDPLALALSIENITDEQVRRLHEIQARIEVTSGPEEFVVLDREFHLATYAGCRAQQLMTTVSRFWNTTQHFRRAYARTIDERGRAIINYEHELLIDAIERRDTVDAERFLAGHIRRTRVTLGSHPELFER